MRRRLDIAAGMILVPEVLLLDEPTTCLDLAGRAEVWMSVRALVASGTAVLLTTQYLDEADQLADRISVLNHGRVIAQGSPEELKSTIGGDRMTVLVRERSDIPAVAELLGRCAGAEAVIEADAVSAPVPDRVAALTEVTSALWDKGIRVADIRLHRPSLDDVFLRLTI